MHSTVYGMQIETMLGTAGKQREGVKEQIVRYTHPIIRVTVYAVSSHGECGR